MEWSDDLLKIFDDPMFDDVHPKAKPISPDDRLAMKLEEINKWIDANGREPSSNGDLKEKLLCRSLLRLRKGKDSEKENLKQYDRLKLL
jgi:hypothetical protein